MARQHAWELDDQEDAFGGDGDSAYAQAVDLVGSLLDMLQRVGGKFTVSAKRVDTGQRIAGIRVFETIGFVVVHDDHVPAVGGEQQPQPSATAEPELDEPDELDSGMPEDLPPEGE